MLYQLSYFRDSHGCEGTLSLLHLPMDAWAVMDSNHRR